MIFRPTRPLESTEIVALSENLSAKFRPFFFQIPFGAHFPLKTRRTP